MRPVRPKLFETYEAEVLIPISKRDDDKRLVFGWMYLPTDKGGNIIVDKHNDFMLPEDLEEAAYKYVDSSRVGGVMHLRDSHLVAKSDKPVKVMSLVESMVFTPEKCEALGIAKNAIPNGAWWVGYRVEHDGVWAGVTKGELTSFSVHGRAKRYAVSKNDGAPAPAPMQQAAPSVTPTVNPPQTVVTQQQGPNGKVTRKKKKLIRPQRPEGLKKAMDVLANAKRN